MNRFDVMLLYPDPPKNKHLTTQSQRIGLGPRSMVSMNEQGGKEGGSSVVTFSKTGLTWAYLPVRNVDAAPLH